MVQVVSGEVRWPWWCQVVRQIMVLVMSGGEASQVSGCVRLVMVPVVSDEVRKMAMVAEVMFQVESGG